MAELNLFVERVEAKLHEKQAAESKQAFIFCTSLNRGKGKLELRKASFSRQPGR